MVGLRVLDFSRVLAGPWAAQHLADHGADVLKVEPPGGDESRAFTPIRDGVSLYFVSCNRNKRSIVLDLRTDAGRAIARDLVRRADVLLHNWRPGVAERLGMDFESLRPLNERLVYVHISAFGSEDPQWSGRAGYDLVLQAMGGGMSITGFPGAPPVRAGTPVADLVAGLLATQAVLHGLLQREQSGRGQRIEVNMMQAQTACLVYHTSRFSVTGEREERRGNAHRGLVPYDVFPCADGWLAVACGNDGLWRKLRAALGIEDHPPWRTNPGRVADRDAVDRAVRAALAPLPVAEADRRLAEAGVPCGRVLDVGEASDHPVARPVTVQHPVLGDLRLAGPTLTTEASRREHRAPPDLGADRDAVLAELGYDAVRIAALATEGAFGGGEG